MTAREQAASDLLTAEEVSALTGTKADTLKRRAQRGSVWAVKKAKTWLFWRGDFGGAGGGE